MAQQAEGTVSRRHDHSSLNCTHDPGGGAELWNMDEVLQQLQNSESSFMPGNSQVVADSERSQCVQTDSLEEAADLLEETGRVILCGFPGTGKTTVGHALLRRCREEGFKPYILSKLEDWHAHIGPGRRSFVLIDGLLGVVRVKRQQFEEWSGILRNMLELMKAGECRVVVTVYPHVLQELQQLETDSQSPLLDSCAVVWLMKEDVDTEVKRKVLDFHLTQLGLQPSQQQEVVERIVQADSSGPAFLWCCRYLLDHWQAVEDPATVFTSPAEAYSVLLKQMCLHETHGDSFAAVLALAMLGKGRFLHRKTGVQSELRLLGFQDYCADHLAEYEDILLGSVLSETSLGFTSRDWYDAAGLALGRSFRLPTLLQACDVTFLLNYVHVAVKGETNKTVKIVVGSGHFVSMARKSKNVTEDCLSLTQRLFKEITTGNLPQICQHTALQCPEFLLEMAECCKTEQFSVQRLIRVVDAIHKLPLLYWSALGKQHTFTNWCLSMLDQKARKDTKMVSPKVLLGLSLFSNLVQKNSRLMEHPILQKLCSDEGFQFSEDIVILPCTAIASSTAESKATLHEAISTAEMPEQQPCYLCDPSLSVPSTLVRVYITDDTVSMQVRDSKDWHLALRLLADRQVDQTDRDGNTLLHIAAHKGNLEALTLAVKSGASLTQKNNKGLTPYQLAQQRRDKYKNILHAVPPVFGAIRAGNEVEVKVFLCHQSSVEDKDSDGRTGLYVACEHGQGNIANLLISLGADVNTCKQNGITWFYPQTVVQHASSKGLTQTVEYLIRSKADINARNCTEQTPLHFACQCESPTASADITRLLLGAGADVNARGKLGNTPLHWASGNGHKDSVKVLIDHGADVNARGVSNSTPLHWASRDDHKDSLEVLIDHGADINARDMNGSTPLHCASRKGHKDCVKALIDRGAYVSTGDKDGDSPLHWTVRLGHTETLTLLIDHGADLNAKNKDDRTPLHHAYMYNRPDIVTQLVEAGAETGHVHQAVVRGDLDALMTLLQKGADVNQHDTNMGCRPLHAACLMGHTDIVTCLLQHGAQVNVEDCDGRMPLSCACVAGAADIFTCLLQNKA